MGDVGMAAFLGRFHVLAVHLPIGLVVLAGALEAATLSRRLRARLDPSLGIVLAGALAAAVIAFALGWLLAWEGGQPPRLVELHRWLALGTVAAAAAACATWWWHRQRSGPRWLHRVVVATLLGTLSLAAHAGGNMTHGEEFLVERAPPALRGLLGAPPKERRSERSERPARAAPAADDRRVFDDVLLPVLEDRCVRCHGEDVTKGGLRLDTVEAILAGGRAGPGVVPRDADASRVVIAVEAPPADDDHMPPVDEPQMTAEEISLLRFWIDRGANRDLRVEELIVPDGARSLITTAAARDAPAPRPARSAAVAQPPATPPAPLAEGASPAEPRAAEPAADPRAAEPSVAAPPSGPAASSAWTAVQAIFSAKCSACHGPAKQKGGLRTDSVAHLLRGGESGPAVVRGDLRRGTLLERVHLPQGDEFHMPPKGELQLEPHELQLIQAWIAPSAAAGTPTSPRAADAKPAVGAAAPAGDGAPAGAEAAVPSGAVGGDGARKDAGTAQAGDRDAPGASGDATEAAAPPSPAQAPATSSGCVGCAVGGRGLEAPGAIAALVLAVALAVRRRPRRSRRTARSPSAIHARAQVPIRPGGPARHASAEPRGARRGIKGSSPRPRPRRSRASRRRRARRPGSDRRGTA